MDVTWTSNGYHMILVLSRISHGYHMDIKCISHGHHMGVKISSLLLLAADWWGYKPAHFNNKNLNKGLFMHIKRSTGDIFLTISVAKYHINIYT